MVLAGVFNLLCVLDDENRVLHASPTRTTKPICVKILLSILRNSTPASAERMHMGTIRMMAKGSAQLSYCAARVRKTKRTQSGKMKSVVFPAKIC